MPGIKIKSVIAALVGSMGILGTSLPHAQTKPGKRIAILIQVAHFQHSDSIPSLTGDDTSPDDIDILGAALKANNFDVRTLKDAQADHDQIVASLNKIASETNKNDTVVFYFTGRGSRTDQQVSLCSWDAFKDTPAKDITESDLEEWLTKRLKTENVTLIIDCSFSDIPTLGKPFSPNYRAKYLARDKSTPSVGGQPFHISPGRAVILSATDTSGAAYLIHPQFNSQWTSMFTYELAFQLKCTSPQTTYQNLMTTVLQRVQFWYERNQSSTDGRLLAQAPTLAGEPRLAGRAPFSPVPPPGTMPPVVVDPVVPTAQVVRIGADRQEITLNAGSSKGFTVDSVIQVQGSDGKNVEATVKKVSPTTSIATLQTPIATKSLNGAQVVVNRFENTINPEQDAVIRLDGSKAFQAAMQKALSSLKCITLVTADQTPNNDPLHPVRLVIKGDIAADGKTTVQLMFPDGVSSIDDTVHTSASIEEMAQKLATPIGQFVALTGIMQLRNFNPIWVQFTPNKPVYQDGEQVILTLQADRDCYFFVYSMDSTGTPLLLYPRDLIRHDNLLRRNEARNLNAGRASVPYGAVTLGVLAVTDPLDDKQLKERLQLIATPANPLAQNSDTNKTGGKSVKPTDDKVNPSSSLKRIQVAPLNQWSISERIVTTVGRLNATNAE